MTTDTLVSAFRKRVAAQGDRPALWGRSSTGWQSLSWRAWDQLARKLAAALVHLGVQPGDRVALILSTRPEWAVLDQAILLAGAVSVSLYVANPAERQAFMLKDCGARLVACEDATQLAKVTSQSAELPALTGLICLDGETSPAWPATLNGQLVARSLRENPCFIPSYSQLLALGEQLLPELHGELERRAQALRPSDMASMLFTSGTTRVPKGARLSHENLLFGGRTLLRTRSSPPPGEPENLSLVALPLAHIMGRLGLVSSCLDGCPAALEPEPARLVQSCAELGATHFTSVPLLYERLYARFQQEPAALRAALGGRVRAAGCGGAALAPHIVRWFEESGVPLREGYGSTEMSIATCNYPDDARIGSAGRAVAGARVRVAPDGELLVASPGVMLGYHERPEEDAAAFVVEDGERWFRSGDIGRVDADGYVWISGRKNDLFKSSAAGWIAPDYLEAQLAGACPLIARAVVIGAGRPHVIALLSLRQGDVAGSTQRVTEQTERLAAYARLQRDIESLNARLSPHERIVDFAVIDSGFSAGELTDLGKPRRTVIAHEHRELIEQLYRERESATAKT